MAVDWDGVGVGAGVGAVDGAGTDFGILSCALLMLGLRLRLLVVFGP